MATESPSNASIPSLPVDSGAKLPVRVPKRPLPAPAKAVKESSVPAATAGSAKTPARPAAAKPVDAPAKSQTQAAAPEEDNEEHRSTFSLWLRNAPAWLISSLFHAALILVLALFTLSSEKVREELSMIVNPSEEFVPLDEAEAEVDVEFDLETEDISESLQVSDLTSFEPDMKAITASANINDSPPAEVTVQDTIAIGPGLATLMENVPGGGSELGSMGPMSKFFGTQSAAQRIAFVVDNSNSMVKGRLETALIELSKSIELLTPEQQFYIVFYSDTAYPMLYPSTSYGMLRATPENKKRVRLWLGTIQMCLRTNAREAFDLALKQSPDVMYVLGDGAIGDRADVRLTQNPVKGITVHTLGMQVKPENAKTFKALAVAHGGTYRDVGITPEGAAMLKREGLRPRNNTFGPVWGIKLPKK